MRTVLSLKSNYNNTFFVLTKLNEHTLLFPPPQNVVHRTYAFNVEINEIYEISLSNYSTCARSVLHPVDINSKLATAQLRNATRPTY